MDFGVPKLFRADRNEHVQTNILGPRIMLELVSQHFLDSLSRLQLVVSDRVGVPDLSVSGDKFDL